MASAICATSRSVISLASFQDTAPVSCIHYSRAPAVSTIVVDWGLTRHWLALFRPSVARPPQAFPLPVHHRSPPTNASLSLPRHHHRELCIASTTSVTNTARVAVSKPHPPQRTKPAALLEPEPVIRHASQDPLSSPPTSTTTLASASSPSNKDLGSM